MNLSEAATPIAQWLNSFFSGYDYAILNFLNSLATGKLGVVLTPLMKLISFLGEKGIMFYALALVLALFPRTRKSAVCIFGAVCCGALITNIVLKDLVARARPYEADAVFRSFWDAVGSPAESGYSFPSGHVTSAAAGMCAISLMKGRKAILPSVIWVLLIMFSRNYLVAHYPSDVLFALIIGVLSAFIAWLITNVIFNFLEDNYDNRVCRFLLDFELPLPSFGKVKEKVSDISFDGIREKAAGISLPEIDLRGVGSKVFRKEEADTDEESSHMPRKSQKPERSNWNDRWDNYIRTKHPEKAVPTDEPAVSPEGDEDVKVYPAPKKEAAPVEVLPKVEKRAKRTVLPTQEEKAPEKGKKLPEKTAKKTRSGEYRGRHEL